MGTPDKKTLGDWFDEMVGVTRSKIALKSLSSEDKKKLLSKTAMRRKLAEGIKAYNSRRKQSHLGTYSYKKHIVYKRFPAIYKQFKEDVLHAEGYRFHSESWAKIGKVRVVRDERGHFITWGRSKR